MTFSRHKTYKELCAGPIPTEESDQFILEQGFKAIKKGEEIYYNEVELQNISKNVNTWQFYPKTVTNYKRSASDAYDIF